MIADLFLSNEAILSSKGEENVFGVRQGRREFGRLLLVVRDEEKNLPNTSAIT